MIGTASLDKAEGFLAACSVAPEVFALRPDYRAMLLVVDGLPASAPSSLADELVAAAEAHAQRLLADIAVEDLPRVAAWRDAYRAFGAKPQRTRNSLESLLRRADAGLPRVNALTDIYNAVSVLHQIPIGGEDLEGYEGSAHLARATGAEPFDTVANGETMIEHPDPGEVVWRDGLGVTCRRWNWRQGRRTALSERTRRAFFILDALAPMSDDELGTAVEALTEALAGIGPEVRVMRRLISE